MYKPYLLLWACRHLLIRSTQQELRKRYSGSLFGLFWMLIQPLVFLSVYGSVFLLIFNVRFELFESEEYVLFIFCGLIPFLGFAEALASGIGSVSSNASLVRNTMFPIELAPIVALLSSQGSQLVGTVLLLVLAYVAKGLSLWALLVIPIWLAQLLFLAGLLWILSGLNVFVRDFQHVIASVILLLMMISPIAYSLDMVPEAMQLIVNINPLAHFIFCMQSVVMLDQAPPTRSLLFVLVGSVALFAIGHSFFVRLKMVLIDNV